MRAERVTEALAYHGEGPIWSEKWGGLRWLDMLAGDILSFATDGTIHRRHVGNVVAAIRPRRGGGAVIGVERGFVLEAPDGTLTTLDELWTDKEVRMNEGGCDPDGRFYCGSTAYDHRQGAGALYRLDSDRSVHVLLESVTISNGLEWSPDGSRAYYNDTATQRVDCFDYSLETGLTKRRLFVDLSGEGLHPDGLTVDAEGGVWVALFGGGAVHRYSPQGVLDAVVEVSARQVTACCFGGSRLDQLYITTSRKGLAADDDPHAGSLFKVDIGISGVPVREWTG